MSKNLQAFSLLGQCMSHMSPVVEMGRALLCMEDLYSISISFYNYMQYNMHCYMFFRSQHHLDCFL